MKVLDPFTHELRELDSYEALDEIDGLVPVKSTSGVWFVVKMVTGESVKIVELPENEIALVEAIRSAIGAHGIMWELIDAAHRARVDGIMGDKAKAALRRLNLSNDKGVTAIAQADRAMESLGFTEDEIAAAYTILDEKDPDIEDVEATRLSDLLEGEGGT
ncbi:hypothetical protein LCGC14_1899940 [marine sediment metagenome]|uniref:Uncharacterized protein n=1 Tax=marine sediment metagenome TaxID=412755 RepID=A0A0F9FX57_9ZZZZ